MYIPYFFLNSLLPSKMFDEIFGIVLQCSPWDGGYLIPKGVH